MYHGKYLAPRRPTNRRRQARHSKRLSLLPALVLALCLTAGVTLAYLFTNTQDEKNIFTPGVVACEVAEIFDHNVKSDVSVRNTGNTDAFIRATVVATWVANDGNAVYAAQPVPGTDYQITYAQTGWSQGQDGYWYYTNAVAPDESTSKLIATCTVEEGKAPAGYHLCVEILASAVQSSPATAVQKAWHVTVNGNTLTP